MVSFKTKLKLRYTFQSFNNFIKDKYVFAIVIVALVLALGGSFTGLSSYVYQYSKTTDDLSLCSGELNSTKLSYGDCMDRASSLSSSLQSTQVSLTECQSRITNDLSACIDDKQNLLSENKKISDQFSSCQISQATTNITSMTVALQNTELTKDFNSLVQNSGKAICCLKNAALSGLGMNITYSHFYEIDNTIVCTDHNDTSLGTQQLSC